MPNTASAKKRLRQNEDRRARNRALRSVLRTEIRKLRTAIQGGDVELCQTQLRATSRRIDQSAAKGVVHANTAARLKSRLSKAVKAIKTAKA